MDRQYEEVLHKSIAYCLQETFKCNIIKHECIVAFEEINWKGYTLDVVGYNESTKSLYIVEAKNNTWLGSNGVAEAIGQSVVYISTLKEKDMLNCIRKYAGIGDRDIQNVYFYIALPDFENNELHKKIYPLALRVIKETRELLSGKIGLLKISDLNKPAEIVTGLEANPIKY